MAHTCALPCDASVLTRPGCLSAASAASPEPLAWSLPGLCPPDSLLGPRAVLGGALGVPGTRVLQHTTACTHARLPLALRSSDPPLQPREFYAWPDWSKPGGFALLCSGGTASAWLHVNTLCSGGAGCDVCAPSGLTAILLQAGCAWDRM